MTTDPEIRGWYYGLCFSYDLRREMYLYGLWDQ